MNFTIDWQKAFTEIDSESGGKGSTDALPSYPVRSPLSFTIIPHARHVPSVLWILLSLVPFNSADPRDVLEGENIERKDDRK